MKFKGTLFEFKIASLMVAGIGFALWLTMYMGIKFIPEPLYHHLGYPFGYWRLLFIPILFSAVYFASIFDVVWYKKILFAEIGLVAVGGICLFVFPEFPNWNILLSFLYYGLVSMSAYLIHYTPAKSDCTSKLGIPDTIKIESDKKSISLWQILIITLIAGYFVLVIQWCRIAWYSYTLETLFTLPVNEKLYFVLLCSTEILLFSLFALFGPVQECLKKIAETREEYPNNKCLQRDDKPYHEMPHPIN